MSRHATAPGRGPRGARAGSWPRAPARGGRRSSPTRSPAAPSVAAADRAAGRRRRSAPRRPAARRRPARPADRVVVLHRPPAGRRRRAASASSSSSSAPSAARFPTSWASHLAITDETGDRFLYGQRCEVGPPVDRSPRDAAGVPDRASTCRSPARDPSRPDDRRAAGLGDGRRGRHGPAARRARARRGDRWPASPGGLGLDLTLAATKPPALHDRDGWIDFGPAGGSYYYSRTAMTATGHARRSTARRSRSTGAAWFDHQWGDFISVGGGGWDWFAVNLDDGTDLTLSLVRDADGTYPLVYGTLVDARRDASGTSTGTRSRSRSPTAGSSPTTGADYPAGWTIRIPGEDLDDRPHADGRGAGARHARDDRRHLLGGLAGRPGDPGRDAARRPGLRGADRLRRGGAGRELRTRRSRPSVRISPTSPRRVAASAQPATIVTA